MNKLAPIALFTYNRLEHTKKTIEALASNNLASESQLYIFSDWAKNENEKSKVIEVRSFIKSISGFKEIKVIERGENLGLANSVIGGVNEIFQQHDNVIVLEDDLVTSPLFLKFMNDCLSFYETNKSIWSITGYCHPIELPKTYDKDVFISHRASSWGWATWKESWQQVNWYNEDYSTFLTNKKVQKKFACTGEDLVPMLKSQIYGKLDSWAIRWSYAHFKNDKYCLFPVKPLIKNIGLDGSGTNFTTSVAKYNTELESGSFDYSLDSDITFNNEIQNEINKLVRLSFIRRIINNFKFSKLSKQ